MEMKPLRTLRTLSHGQSRICYQIIINKHNMPRYPNARGTVEGNEATPSHRLLSLMGVGRKEELFGWLAEEVVSPWVLVAP